MAGVVTRAPGAAPPRLVPSGWSLAGRQLRFWLTNYRRTWRGSIYSSVLNPVLFLGAIGLGLGSLVNAHHHLHGVGRARPCDGDVRVRYFENVVGHEMARALEPKLSEAVQNLPFERDGGEHAVEGAEPVGGDEE